MKNIIKVLIFSLVFTSVLSITHAEYTAPGIQITDVSITPNPVDFSTKPSVAIGYKTNAEAYVTLVIKKGSKKVGTFVNEQLLGIGAHTYYWNGTYGSGTQIGESGDDVPSGTYTYTITATNSETVAQGVSSEATKSGTITVEGSTADESDDGDDDTGDDASDTLEYTDPNIEYFYVTKESFDPEWEYAYIIFYLTSRADIKVEIYNSTNTLVETLYDEEDQPAGLYKLQFDGESYYESDYTYKISVENIEGKDIATGEIEVKEDSAEDPNVYKDKVDIDDIPYEIGSGDLPFTFKLDEDSDITFEIRHENSLVVRLLDEEGMSAGMNTINWNGKDDDEEYVSEGIYEYKIIAGNSGGTDTERGNFSVSGEEEESTNEENEVVEDTSCARFDDVENTYKYCTAIIWAKTYGIFDGYPDNTFRPYQPIRRGELLKVIIEAFDIQLVSAGTINMGFKDIEGYEWFVNYLATAASKGFVNGYSDKTFRPENQITRTQALKVMLEAAKLKYDLEIPAENFGNPYKDVSSGYWYTKYAWIAKENSLSGNENYFFPNNPMTRGEMADMLYRFKLAGLDE
jgi:flagellar hook assembly protein FlgD